MAGWLDGWVAGWLDGWVAGWLGGWMIRRKLRTALSLSWRDRWVLLQAWVLLLAVDLGLRVLSFRRVQRLVALGRRAGDARQADGAPATIQRLGWLVGVAGRNHLYSVRCLQRSLVLQWLLARRGITTELRIGVQREVDGLCAHAWLEQAGRPIGEPQYIAVCYEPLMAGEAS